VRGALALVVALTAMPTVAGERARLAVEARGDGAPAFRVWNPSPFAAPPATLRISFERRGRHLHAETQPLAGLGPFESTTVEVPGWASFAPGSVRACVEVGPSRASCADLPLPGTQPDLTVGAVRVDGGRLVVEVRNEGDVPSGPFGVSATTRAGERVVGTTTRGLAPLDRRSTREESIAVERWGAGDVAAFPDRCRTTRIRLDPRGRVAETDETNNARELRHAPAAPLIRSRARPAGGSPPARRSRGSAGRRDRTAAPARTRRTRGGRALRPRGTPACARARRGGPT